MEKIYVDNLLDLFFKVSGFGFSCKINLLCMGKNKVELSVALLFLSDSVFKMFCYWATDKHLHG